MADEKSLFGNMNLGNMDFIEVSDGSEEPQVTPSATNKSTDIEIEVDDDNFIEVPDNVQETDDEDTAVDEIKVEDVKTEKNPPQHKGNSSSSQFTPFAKALYEEGVLTSFDEAEFIKMAEEMGAAEALIELNRKTIESEIEAYKNEVDEEYRSFIEARDAGVDLNDWGKIQSNKKKYASIDEQSLSSDVDLQKNLITEDLLRRGFDEEQIKDTIESFEDTNKLEKQAKNALKNLEKHQDSLEKQLKEEADNAAKAQEEAQKKQLADLKKAVDTTTEIIPGMKLNKQTKDKLYSMITSPVGKASNGEPVNAAMAKRLQDPIKYALLEAYFVDLGLFDGKFDKLVSKQKTTAIKELESALSSKNNTGFSSSNADTLENDSDYVAFFDKAFGNVTKIK